MEFTWKQEYLDFVLVPIALLVLLGYHLLHLHRCVKVPLTTVIGYENYNKKAWVERVLQIEPKERGQALAVIGTNISAATSLASMSLALSSLIGAWIGNSYHNDTITSSIYGNTGTTIAYVKYVALLTCFLVAFACFIQTARCYINANFLISMPNCEMGVSNVEHAVISGSNFWTVGVRSLYFATNLLLWIFGPIPMFLSSVITVVLLHYLDRNGNPTPDFNPKVKYESPKMTPVNGTIELSHSPNGKLNDDRFHFSLS